MKNWIIIIALLLLPLVLFSTVNQFKDFYKNLPIYPGKMVDRTWRLNEIIGEYYSDIEWVIQNKEVFVYNDVHPTRVDTIKTYYYDMTTSEWSLASKAAYDYDTSGNYCTDITYMIVYFGVEIPFIRFSFDYDNQHRLTLMVMEGFAGMDKDWTLGSWTKIFYNPTSVNYIMNYTVGDDVDPSVWEKVSLTNDMSGRPIISTTQASTDSTIWVNTERSMTTYHPNDNSTGMDYINAMASMFMYFGSSNPSNNGLLGMVSETTDQYYDEGWFDEYKEVFTYNNQNMLTEKVEKFWDGVWVNDYQSLYTYNNDNQLYQVTENYWLAPSDWLPTARFTYDWGLTTANNDEYIPVIGDFHVSAYPNPFANELSISLSSKEIQPTKVAIYNAKGQMIKDINAKTNTKIVWDGKDKENRAVSNGIYFIKASSNHQTQTRKVILVK